MAAGSKAIFYALLANGGIALTKGAAAFFTGSTSMTAEAIHSLADCGNQILLLVGLKKAASPATALHPLGYGKVSYFWAFIVAVLLFAVGGIFSIYEGCHKLLHQTALEKPLIAVAVLLVGLVLESISLYGALREIRPERGSRSLYRWFRETRQSELLVVIGEDIAALLGLAFALVFVLVAMLTGNALFDAIGSIVIGSLLIGVATLLAFEIQSLIVGESAPDAFILAFRAFVQREFAGVEILNLISQQYGHDIMLAIKARFKTWPRHSRLLVDQINTIEIAIRKEFPAVRFLFFEPDIDSNEKRKQAVKKAAKKRRP